MNRYTHLLSIFFVVLLALGGCKKDDADKMKLIVNYPIIDAGQEVTFTIVDPIPNKTGIRFDPGDGSNPFNVWSNEAKYTYNTPGSYTATAIVFADNKSYTITVDLEVVGQAVNNNNNNNNQPGIRITGIDVVQLTDDRADSDYITSSTDIRNMSDVYFKVSYSDYSGSNISIIYPKSEVKFDADPKTWSLGTAIPIIYYKDDNIDRIDIEFYDDDSREQSGDDYLARVTVNKASIEAYEASKPTEVQLYDFGDITINVTLEWIN